MQHRKSPIRENSHLNLRRPHYTQFPLLFSSRPINLLKVDPSPLLSKDILSCDGGDDDGAREKEK